MTAYAPRGFLPQFVRILDKLNANAMSVKKTLRRLVIWMQNVQETLLLHRQ